MRIKTIYLVAVLLAPSCIPEDAGDNMPPPDGYHHLKGKVSGSHDNKPIEHIKVTIDWNNGMQKDVKYTSSDGYFTAELPKGKQNSIPVGIRLEDTDGEENGGLFETITDNIIFRMPSEDTPTAILEYRLNPATASESSPQF